MATSDQIDRAAVSDRVTTGSEYMNSGHILHRAAGTPEAEALELTRAAKYIHRVGGEHASEFLQALGLIPYQRGPAPGPATEKNGTQ